MLSQIFMRHDFSHCFGFSEVLFLVKTALLEALFVDSPKNSNSNPQISQNGRKTTPKTPHPPDFGQKPPTPDFVILCFVWTQKVPRSENFELLH